MVLKTTDHAFHALWKEIHKVRETSTTVKVDKQMLKDLLNDHSDLVQKTSNIETRP